MNRFFRSAFFPLVVDYRETDCDRPRLPCGAFVHTRGDATIGEVEVKLADKHFLKLRGRGNRILAMPGAGGILLAARVSNLRRLRAEVFRTPFRLTFATGGRRPRPPLVIDARLTSPSASWKGALGMTLRDLPNVLRLCFDRGPACAESGEQAANSLLVTGDERPDGVPLKLRAVLCFKQVRPGDCSGRRSARVVLFAKVQHLGVELTPTDDGYAFLNTVPRGGKASDALALSGDIGYFSDERQRACFKLGDGAYFARRKYFRPPPGSRSYGRGGGRSITFGHERPDLRCDQDRTPDGLRPNVMPREEVPTERFTAPAKR